MYICVFAETRMFLKVVEIVEKRDNTYNIFYEIPKI